MNSTRAAIQWEVNNFDKVPLAISTDITVLQAELERARGEYAVERLEVVVQILEELLPKLRQSLERTGDQADYAVLLASALCLEGRMFGRRGESAKASASFQESVELFYKYGEAVKPEMADSRLYTDHGIALFRLGRYRESAAILDEACGARAAPAEAYGYLGLSSRELNQLQKAEKALRKALELRPGDKHLFVALAETLDQAAKPAEAADAYCKAALAAGQAGDHVDVNRLLSRALVVDPGNEHAVAIATAIKRWQGDDAGAMVLLESVLRVDPNHNWAMGLKAKVLRDQGDRQRAIELFRRVDVQSPDLYWVLLELAKTLHDLSPQYDREALKCIERAAQLNSNEPDVFVAEAQIIEATDRSRALRILLDATERFPQSPQVYLALAEILARGRDNAGALAAIDACLAIDPKSATAWVARARIFSTNEDWAEASAALDKAIRIDPKSTNTLVARAQVLEKLGDFDEALALWRRAFKFCPEDPVVFRRYFEALTAHGHEDQALEELSRIIDRNAENGVAYWVQGRILDSLERPEEAIPSLQRAAALCPANGEIHANLGEVFRRTDRYEEAGTSFDQALKLNPESAYILGLKAFYLSHCASFEAAAEMAEQAARISPGDSLLYWLLGWAWQHIGLATAQKAREAYTRATELDKDDAFAWRGLANVLYDCGERQEAKAIFTKLIEQQPTSEDYKIRATELSLLGWCNYRLGQYDEALRLFQSCLSIDPEENATSFDLALALLASGRRVGVEQYSKAVEQTEKRHIFRQRGLYYVALFDLVNAAADNRLGESGGVRGADATECFSLLRSSLVKSGVDIERVRWLGDGLPTKGTRGQAL